MIKLAKLAAVAAVMVAAMPFSAEAFPVATAPASAVSADVTLVSGGCGLAFHRGPLGGCRPNGFLRPVIRRPVIVAPIVRRPLICRTVLLPLPHRVCR